MATAAPIATDSSRPYPTLSPNVATVKALSESGLTSIPPSFASKNLQDLPVSDIPGDIPVIDFTLLTSNNPDERSRTIHDLGKACEEWGIFAVYEFQVINHPIQESLINGMMDGLKSFFDLSDEEKREFKGNHVLDPIRCGSSFNTAVENVHCWRDFLKVFVHPEFHFPHKPAGFSDTAYEYFKKCREVMRELVKGVSESLGLEPNYISKYINLESGLQAFVGNYYPPCPQPELAVGIHPHSDQGLMTIVTQNGISGLQTLHNGKWVKVEAPPNALMVNVADQLEIVTNGKYLSNVHRAVLYSNATRISLVTASGPELDKVIKPVPELVNESNPVAYNGITYREFYEIHNSTTLDKKSVLDRIRIRN